VANLANIFKPGAGTRPALVCEIRPEGVVAARASAIKGGSEIVMAFAPLAAGALTPGLKVPNLGDASGVRAALESALGEVNARGRARSRALTVVVPDAAARVLLLDFDSLPAKRQEALSVVRFRLRKTVPFDVETAAVSYQVMAQKSDQLNVLVTVMPADVLAEYESVTREAGYEPGAVLPSTLAAAAGVATSGATLMVNRAGDSVTTAVTQGEEMLLHRSMDLPADPAARDEEMAQAVITALAWYEDTLHASPGAMYYSGAGGADAGAQARWMQLAGSVPRLADFTVPEHASSITTVPPGMVAGVVGALATP
jgi:type IV pilus assembly protein PilM